MKKVVDTHYAKSAEYGQVIETISQKGVCPFCPANFRYHKNPILRRSGNWFITKNSWPYKKTNHHFLIISTRHKEHLDEVKEKDFASILILSRWVVRKFKISGGALAMRFGETSHTGATVCHLHCHLVVPKMNRKTKRAQTVMFPIG